MDDTTGKTCLDLATMFSTTAFQQKGRPNRISTVYQMVVAQERSSENGRHSCTIVSTVSPCKQAGHLLQSGHREEPLGVVARGQH